MSALAPTPAPAVMLAPGRYMAFRLADETYGIEILKVRELIAFVEITRVPGAPAFVRGVINLRGKVIPVVDLRRRLGLPDLAPHPHSVIMVVQSGPQPMGLLVDEVLDVLRLDAAQLGPASGLGFGAEAIAMLLGVAQVQERVVFLIDLERVLAPQAQSSVGTP